MGIFDYIFKSKKEREQDKRANDALNRADDIVERTERILEEMQRDDKRWRNGL